MLDNKFNNNKLFLARKLIQHGMFKTREQSPSGKGFRLALHKKNPDAPLSPYYIDLRLLRSFPPLPRYAAELLFAKTQTDDVAYALVADVPTAATPIVTFMSEISGRPMITPREPKDHGSQATIDGVYQPGQTALAVDDLITGADSKLTAVKILRDAGLIVTDVAVLLDREQGGEAQLAKHGLRLHAIWTITDLLAFYEAENLIPADLVQEINEYRRNACT
jgi:uridine monophosphate synthetase